MWVKDRKQTQDLYLSLFPRFFHGVTDGRILEDQQTSAHMGA